VLVSENLLPTDETLMKIQRYEAHLHRLLMHDLHELEAMQSRRRGESARSAG
jgi:hypothetical protein